MPMVVLLACAADQGLPKLQRCFGGTGKDWVPHEPLSAAFQLVGKRILSLLIVSLEVRLEVVVEKSTIGHHEQPVSDGTRRRRRRRRAR